MSARWIFLVLSTWLTPDWSAATGVQGSGQYLGTRGWGQILSRRDVGAAADDEGELDLGICFLKKLENVLEDRSAVDGEPRLFPGCLHQLFPIALPVRLRRRLRRKDEEENEVTEEGGDFHFFPRTLIDEAQLQGFPERELQDLPEKLCSRQSDFGGSYDIAFARQRLSPGWWIHRAPARHGKFSSLYHLPRAFAKTLRPAFSAAKPKAALQRCKRVKKPRSRSPLRCLRRGTPPASFL